MTDSCLYIVATPIGNLGDITVRAQEVLRSVDAIAAEDTRHTSRLLKHLVINKPLIACHDHNERSRGEQIVGRILAGESIALVSDAGTPLISDPGYHLVRMAREAGVRVVPVPGACAFVAAMSVAGLPTDRFLFEGFLPAKQSGRKKRLENLAVYTCTWIVYESPHRIRALLDDMAEVLGKGRQAVLARELTKTFETILSGSVDELQQRLADDSDQSRGEFVVLVKGAEPVEASVEDGVSEEALRQLAILLEELPLKQASNLVAKMTGERKKKLYEAGLGLRQEN